MSFQWELAAVFRIWAETIDALADKEFQALLKGEGKLVFEYVGSSCPTTSTISKGTPKDDNIITTLTNCESREQAREVLVTHNLTKVDLARLAASLKIRVIKSDTKEKITNKIIEATVGTRLRANAIKDINLKR